MAHLAMRPDETPQRAQVVSEATDIPIHYLSKIMRRLVKAGLLHSQKGHGGGFRLAKATADVRFMDVLNAVDYDVDSSNCVFGWESCTPTKPCPLHPFWRHLKVSFIDWAEHHTLNEVQTARSELSTWMEK